MIEALYYRDAMAQLAGAVSIITTNGEAGPFGFTASAVCSVTDSPPMLLVCMNRQSRQHEAFQTNAVLCVNVLASTQQVLSSTFANKTLGMQQRFEHGKWIAGPSGSPLLLGALANFECRIHQVHEVGTHSIFIGEVMHIDSDPRSEGLVYFDRGYYRVGNAAQMEGIAV
jgi:flavin reductase